MFAIWGLFGGFITDGLEFWRAVKANGGNWPPGYGSWAFLVGELFRLCAGAGLAVAFGRAGQVNGEIGALALGAAAPLVVEKIAQWLPPAPPAAGGQP